MRLDIDLPPEFVSFAQDCVHKGRFRDIDDVVRAALNLLRQTELERARFRAMVREVEADIACHGTIPIEQVLADVDDLIARSNAEQ